MVSMNIHTIPAAAICLALTASVAAANPQPIAQEVTTGTITGYVRDTRGRPIAQAQVKILGTGEITATDQSGAYIFTGEDPGLYIIQAHSAKYRAESLTITVQPGMTETLNLVLADASHTSIPIAKGKKPPTAIVSVIESQGHRVSPPDPIANGPLNPFQGDLGLHSTARSR